MSSSARGHYPSACVVSLKEESKMSTKWFKVKKENFDITRFLLVSFWFADDPLFALEASFGDIWCWQYVFHSNFLDWSEKLVPDKLTFMSPL